LIDQAIRRDALFVVHKLEKAFRERSERIGFKAQQHGAMPAPRLLEERVGFPQSLLYCCELLRPLRGHAFPTALAESNAPAFFRIRDHRERDIVHRSAPFDHLLTNEPAQINT